jgi:hypothetical protein
MSSTASRGLGTGDGQTSCTSEVTKMSGEQRHVTANVQMIRSDIYRRCQLHLVALHCVLPSRVDESRDTSITLAVSTEVQGSLALEHGLQWSAEERASRNGQPVMASHPPTLPQRSRPTDPLSRKSHDEDQG